MGLREQISFLKVQYFRIITNERKIISSNIVQKNVQLNSFNIVHIKKLSRDWW